VIERFRNACAQDDRVEAAFLGGSLAAGRADEHSDLDLYVVAREDACVELVDRRQEFVAAWGDPVFVDVTRDFEGLGFDMLHFVLADGLSGEVAIAHAGNLRRIHGGPHRVLVDKAGVLEGVEFPLASPSRDERRAAGRRALSWFWLHMLGLTKALARDRLWVAQWQLNQLRRCLWRLLAAAELPAREAQLHERMLAGSLVGFDRDQLFGAAGRLVETYHALAPRAAAHYGLEVPLPLARVAEARLRAIE
jgi:predicted nucleotidyltransferase